VNGAWTPGGRTGRLRGESSDAGVRPRRLRSGEAAETARPSRREQANARVLQLRDEEILERRAFERLQPQAVGWRVGGLRLDADGLFAFLLFLPLLFMAKLGSAGAAAVAGLLPLYVFLRRERLADVLWPRSFLFLPPALAVFSVLWSQAPSQTLKTGVEYGLTVLAGVLLSSARDQGAVLKGLCLAFLAYVAASIAFGGSVAVGVGAGGYAFSGLTGSKNLLGDIASSGLIVSLAVAMIGVRHRQWLWPAVGGAAMLLDLYVVGAARSAGALLGLVMGAGALLGLALLMPTGRVVRAWLTAALTLCLVAAGLSYRWLAQALINLGAQAFDKDPTLTGRTYLWYRADDLIREHPLLGRGYQSFWIQGNIDAEGLWRYFGIDERGGFTFHNTAVEILVGLGALGLAVIAGVTVIGAVFLVRRFVERPTIALCCWMSLFLYQFARTPIETIGVAPFYFSTVLAFAALGAGFGRLQAARIARPVYAPPGAAYAAAPRGWAHARPTPEPGALRLLRREP